MKEKNPIEVDEVVPAEVPAEVHAEVEAEVETEVETEVGTEGTEGLTDVQVLI